jgi:agmatinase
MTSADGTPGTASEADLRAHPLFANLGIPTFLRSQVCVDLETLDADIAVMGVPTDEGSPFLPGTRFGPRAIREHSLRFAGGPGYYDPQSRRTFLEREMRGGRIVDAGDAVILPTNVVETFGYITTMARAILNRGAILAVIGGDHAITYPVVRAFSEPLHVMHFDAHLDYLPFVHGLDMTNGHAFRHISHMPHVKSLTQIGIRSIRNSRVTLEDSLADGNRVVTMDEFRAEGPEVIIGDVPPGADCYVSIDIDVLDMSLIPGCVSAEPNGMYYAELRDSLALLADRTRVVGFDLVEVNPMLDVGTGITSYLAAHTMIEFLGQICSQERYLSERSSS